MGRSVLIGELTRAAVVAYLDALNSHDADRIAACVAENFVNEHTSSMGHNRFGRIEYRAALTGFLADFAELHYDVEELIVDGERAAAAYRMSFRLVSADGAPVSVRGVFRFRVDNDGLIAHRVDYWDSGEVRRQLPGG
ncbi:MAG: nuclear transport factor 2 family protein [Jatrophihabitantaceae bacterium]